MQPDPIEVPRWLLQILNNVCEIERKLGVNSELAPLRRNIERIKDALQHQHLFYEDPMGQSFSDTRNDLDASISGVGNDNLVVVEVIKPIVRLGTADFSRVVQRGIVVVQSKTP